MKLLITGGHISPALACIDEISKKSNVEIVFVGRKYNNEREKTLSFEYDEITGRKIKFINITAGRLTRFFSLRNIRNAMNFPIGFMQAFSILKKEKPDVILTFGGYIGLPIAIVGHFLKIPVYIHEQTIYPGITNRILGKTANKIFISFEQSKKFFQDKNVIVSGNPIRNQVFKTIKKPFEIEENLPVIYVTGGSLGSHSINVHIDEIIPKLLENYIVIHQVGNVSEYNDYSRLVERRNELPARLQKRYFLRAHFQTEEVGYLYSIADLVICRSGANTFFELIALKKPAILIPLPWSAHNEQQKQAEIIAKAGAGEIFNQTGKSEDLFSLIKKIMNNKDEYIANFKKLETHYPKNAAEIIASEIG